MVFVCHLLNCFGSCCFIFFFLIFLSLSCLFPVSSSMLSVTLGTSLSSRHIFLVCTLSPPVTLAPCKYPCDGWSWNFHRSLSIFPTYHPTKYSLDHYIARILNVLSTWWEALFSLENFIWIHGYVWNALIPTVENFSKAY